MAGLIRRGPTGFRKVRPARPSKLKSGQPPLTRNRRRRRALAGTSPPRCTNGVSGKPESGKAHGSTDRRRIDRRLEMAGTDGSMPRRRATASTQSAAQSRVLKESGSHWFGGRYPDENQSGRLRRCQRHVGLRRGNAHGTVRPEQSCEGRNPMSGAGWRAIIDVPATPARRRKIARAETGTSGITMHRRGECLKGLHDPTPRATANATDRVATPKRAIDCIAAQDVRRKTARTNGRALA